MLANSPTVSTNSGSLSPDVHLPATSRFELIEFIASELPRWRDRIDRPHETSETVLTSQLCGHLNSAARLSSWDFLQFRVEEQDEQKRNRKIDLVPSPCGATVIIEGRRHTDFDTILPIECKRLPTPTETGRDEREYVVSKSNSTGGIHRFKVGLHGGTHAVGAMIAYVQTDTPSLWTTRVENWIKDMIDAGQAGWSPSDYLLILRDDSIKRLTVLRSTHSRLGKGAIELRHLWVGMN
jgi:hypothetical protein